MGQTTPNMSIYVPSNNETGYGQSFAAGMTNVDQHDHSGPPNKGVPIASGGIADGSITATKLNSNVLTIGGGLAFDINNAIEISAPVTIADGGTAATSFGTTNGVVKYDGSKLVTSATATYNASNVFNNTAQPAFSYFLTAETGDVTGDGTQYQIGIAPDPLTKIFDQANNFDNGSAIFTAPVNGIYQITVMVDFHGGVKEVMNIAIVTTNRTYYPNSTRTATTSGEVNINATVLADMNAGDTAYILVSSNLAAGGGSKTVSLMGDSSLFLTGIQAWLVC